MTTLLLARGAVDRTEDNTNAWIVHLPEGSAADVLGLGSVWGESKWPAGLTVEAVADGLLALVPVTCPGAEVVC